MRRYSTTEKKISKSTSKFSPILNNIKKQSPLRQHSNQQSDNRPNNLFNLIKKIQSDIIVDNQFQLEKFPIRKENIATSPQINLNPFIDQKFSIIPKKNNFENHENISEQNCIYQRNNDSNSSIVNCKRYEPRINNYLVNKKIERVKTREIKKTKNIYDSFEDNITDDDIEPINNYSKFLIDPLSKFKIYWDFYIFFLIFYTITISSFRMCFDMNNEISFFYIFECFIDLSFIVDLILQFFIPYVKRGIVVRKRYLIFKKYMKTWFLIDLISCFPSNLIGLFFIRNLQIQIPTIARVYKSGSWLKIFRFLKMGKHSVFGMILQKILITSEKSVNRVIKFVLFTILLVHISSCIWIYIGLLPYPATWIKNNGLSNSSPLDIYIAALYFNFVTVYTIGYGDITPTNKIERIFNINFMIIGGFLYSFTISCLSMIFFSIKTKDQIRSNKLGLLNKYRKNYKISEKLFGKIKKTIEQQIDCSKIDNNSILESLTGNLKKELILKLNTHLINEFRILQNKPNNFVFFVLQLLKPIVVSKGDVLFSAGEFVNEAYFVKKGLLSIEVEYDFHRITLGFIQRNYHFGEVLMYINEQSPYNLKVKSKISEIFVLNKNDFSQIKTNFGSIINNVLSDSIHLIELLEKRRKILTLIHSYEIDYKISQKRIIKLNYELLNKIIDRNSLKTVSVIEDPYVYLDQLDDENLKKYFCKKNVNLFESKNVRKRRIFSDFGQNFLVKITKFQEKLNFPRKNKIKENKSLGLILKKEFKLSDFENKSRSRRKFKTEFLKYPIINSKITNKLLTPKIKLQTQILKNDQCVNLGKLNIKKYAESTKNMIKIPLELNPPNKRISVTNLAIERKNLFTTAYPTRKKFERNFTSKTNKLKNSRTKIELEDINKEIQINALANQENVDNILMENLRFFINKNDLFIQHSKDSKLYMKKLDRILQKINYLVT